MEACESERNEENPHLNNMSGGNDCQTNPGGPPLNIGDHCLVLRNDTWHSALIIHIRPNEQNVDEYEYLVHYDGYDRRLEEWVNRNRIDLTSRLKCSRDNPSLVLSDQPVRAFIRNQKRKLNAINYVQTTYGNIDPTTGASERPYEADIRMSNIQEITSGLSVKSIDSNSDRKYEIEREQDLFKAAFVGNFAKVQELLESGVSVETEELNKLLQSEFKNYITPLQIAAANGNENCIKILLDYGANVNAKDAFNITALHMAAQSGHVFCIILLLEAGADCCVPTKFSIQPYIPHAPYPEGTTPLHLAAANNNVSCIKKLVQYGADYNAVDEYGRTSLYIAAEAGLPACVLALLRSAFGRQKILSIPSFHTSDIPLHFAVLHTMVDCVKELLYLGSDVNHCNNYGISPIHLAVCHSPNENSVLKMEILKLLVLEGSNIDINCCNRFGLKPLHFVCFNGYSGLLCRRPEMAKFLIAYGADINIKNKLKMCRRPEMAKFLIAYGADINITNESGISLLECELESPEENYEILRYLVKNMPYLPSLESLNVASIRNVNNVVMHDAFDFFHSPDWLKIRITEVISVAGNIALNDNIEEIPEERNLEAIPDEMHIEEIPDDGNFGENEDNAEGNLPFESSYVMEKHLWYNEKSSKPLSLMHNCRYVIRNIMGATKLKYVKYLPIPDLMKSYLLLEIDK